jgi:hypothetical protein
MMMMMMTVTVIVIVAIFAVWYLIHVIVHRMG